MTIRNQATPEEKSKICYKIITLVFILVLAQLTFPTTLFLSSRFNTFYDSNKTLFLNILVSTSALYITFKPGRKIANKFQQVVVTFVLFVTGLAFAFSNLPLLRNAFGISKMKQPFADWLAIFDFLHCRRGFGNTICDRFHRPWIYSDSYRILSFVKSEHIFVILGLSALMISLYQFVGLLKKYIGISHFILIGFSPSFLFEMDRLNVDFLLFAIFLASFSAVKSDSGIRRFSTQILRISLNLFKPFFIIHSPIRRGRLTTLCWQIVLSLTFILLSFRGFNNLQFARRATLYDQHSQFGSQYVGQLFLATKDPTILAIFGLIAVFLFAVCMISLSDTDSFEFKNLFSFDSRKFETISCAASLYLVLYLSGSQVQYASLSGLIFSGFLLFHRFEFALPAQVLIGFGFIGCLGFGFSLLRVVSSTSLAVLALVFLLLNLSPNPKRYEAISFKKKSSSSHARLTPKNNFQKGNRN